MAGSYDRFNFCFLRSLTTVSIVTVLICSFAYWFKDMRILRWLSDSLKFNGIFVVTSGGSIPPFGANTSRPVEHKVTRRGSKHFANGLWEVMVSCVTPISSPYTDSIWETTLPIYWILIREPCPSHARYCHLTGIITVFQRPFCYQTSSFILLGIMVRPMHSMTICPFLHLICYWVPWSEVMLCRLP